MQNISDNDDDSDQSSEEDSSTDEDVHAKKFLKLLIGSISKDNTME